MTDVINNKVKQEQLKQYKELYERILKWKEEDVYKCQESIFIILKLLNNGSFIEEIFTLRKTMDIPSYLYDEKKQKKLIQKGEDIDNLLEKGWDMLNDKYQGLFYENEFIQKLGFKYNIDPVEYGELLVDYLCYGNMCIYVNTFRNYKGKEEFRYKTRLIYKQYDPGEQVVFKPGTNRAYIQIFKDTSVNSLIKFIKADQSTIMKITKYLKEFPTNRKSGKSMKKFLLIYLLRKQRYSFSVIADKISVIYPESLVDYKTAETTFSRFNSFLNK